MTPEEILQGLYDETLVGNGPRVLELTNDGLALDMEPQTLLFDALIPSLEEVGAPYDVRLVSFEAVKQPAHMALQPFGQIPTYEEGELVLFESGAIVLHIAERHSGLLPHDADARARAIAWMFAALSSVEPAVMERSMTALFERDKPWHKERLELLDGRVRNRLEQLAARLGARLRFRARLRDFDAVCRLVAAGVGIAVIPEAAAKRCARVMAIKPVRIRDAWATRRLAICVRNLKALPRPAQQLVAHLRGDGI